jgi:hypothetical protein
MAAADLITFDELRSKLMELEDVRKSAEREVNTLRYRKEHLDELKRDRGALHDSLMGLAPEALDTLSPDEHLQIYKMLKLKVFANADGSLELSGAFGDIYQSRETKSSRCLCCERNDSKHMSVGHLCSHSVLNVIVDDEGELFIGETVLHSQYLINPR